MQESRNAVAAFLFLLGKRIVLSPFFALVALLGFF